jgi:hypothetical protein
VPQKGLSSPQDPLATRPYRALGYHLSADRPLQGPVGVSSGRRRGTEPRRTAARAGRSRTGGRPRSRDPAPRWAGASASIQSMVAGHSSGKPSPRNGGASSTRSPANVRQRREPAPPGGYRCARGTIASWTGRPPTSRRRPRRGPLGRAGRSGPPPACRPAPAPCASWSTAAPPRGRAKSRRSARAPDRGRAKGRVAEAVVELDVGVDPVAAGEPG